MVALAVLATSCGGGGGHRAVVEDVGREPTTVYRATIPYLAAGDLPDVVAPGGAVTPLPEVPTPAVEAQGVNDSQAPALQQPGQLTEDEMRALYVEAGVPAEWVDPLLAIAWCESRYRPGEVGDGGNSIGLHQLWTGWAAAAGYTVADLYDPYVNTVVAVYVREVRGRFGGRGGWTCADILGIP